MVVGSEVLNVSAHTTPRLNKKKNWKRKKKSERKEGRKEGECGKSASPFFVVLLLLLLAPSVVANFPTIVLL